MKPDVGLPAVPTLDDIADDPRAGARAARRPYAAERAAEDPQVRSLLSTALGVLGEPRSWGQQSGGADGVTQRQPSEPIRVLQVVDWIATDVRAASGAPITATPVVLS